MISHIGKVNLEVYKKLKATQREEVEGKIEEKEVEITARFDFSIPMGMPYDLTVEVLDELKAEVLEMQKKSRELAEKELEDKADVEIEN